MEIWKPAKKRKKEKMATKKRKRARDRCRQRLCAADEEKETARRVNGGTAQALRNRENSEPTVVKLRVEVVNPLLAAR